MTSEKVKLCGIVRDNDYIYYVDKEGDVSRSPRAMGRKKKKDESFDKI